MTGALGFVWAIAWLAIYRRPDENPHVDAAELAMIQVDRRPADGAPVRWITLLGRRQTWAFVVGKLMADPIW